MINRRAIEELVPRAREHTNWELWDAVLSRDRKRALRLAQRLLDDGAEPVMLVGMLASLYRKMLSAKELMTRGAARQDVDKATSRYGRGAQEFNEHVRRATRLQLVLDAIGVWRKSTMQSRVLRERRGFKLSTLSPN